MLSTGRQITPEMTAQCVYSTRATAHIAQTDYVDFCFLRRVVNPRTPKPAKSME